MKRFYRLIVIVVAMAILTNCPLPANAQATKALEGLSARLAKSTQKMQKAMNKMTVKTKNGVNNGFKKAASNEAAMNKGCYMLSKQFVLCPHCSGKEKFV